MTENRKSGYGSGQALIPLAPVPFRTNKVLGTTDYQYNIGQIAYEIPTGRWVLYNGDGIWIPLVGTFGNIDSITVDTSGAGLNPVLPNSQGSVIFTAAQVSASTTVNAIQTNSTVANTVTIDIQQAGSGGSASPILNGVASFNSAQFTVSNGFVSLSGSGDVASITATAPLTANGASGTPETGAVTVALTTPLALQYGGTNANLTASNGGIFYSTATAGAILSGTATANQMLQSGSSTTPAWSTATWPATTTINDILYSSANNVVGQITAANNGVLISGTTGIPSYLAAGTTGQVLVATTSNPASWATLSGIAVTSIAGTANQITASASTGAVTLSIPSTFIAPGSIQATTSVTAATGDIGLLIFSGDTITTQDFNPLNLNASSGSIFFNTNAGWFNGSVGVLFNNSNAGNYTLSWPGTSPTTNYLLGYNGSNNLAWYNIAAGTGISVSPSGTTITISATGTTTLNVTSVTHGASPYTVISTDDFLACQTSGGVITIKLPNAPATGRVYVIKDSNGAASTSNISVTTVGGTVTIDGQTTYTMSVNYQSISVCFDGTNYEVF